MINSKNRKNKIFLVAALALLFLFPACSNKDKSSVGSSGVSLYYLGLTTSRGSLPADGASQSTIMVEVWDSSGTYVDGASVYLTVSRGTLAASTLTTVNGVITTTFTAGTSAGAAYVDATVENASASVKIVLATY